MAKPTFSDVVANRGFRVLWINQVLMQFSTNTLNFALIVWVYRLTNSNLAVSALLLSVYLPALVFGLLAGVLVDRTDRKKLIIILDLLFALGFFIFPFIRFIYPLLLINTFFVNSVAQFFTPTEGSSIPLLVKKDQLFIANSLFTFTLFGCFMLGFTIAGPVLHLFSITPIFYVGGVLLVIGSLLSQQLPSLTVKVANKNTPILSVVGSETKETFEFIRSKLPVSVSIILLSAMQGVIGVLAVLVPSYMERVLHVHATDASIFLMLPLGLGMISGALIIGRFFQFVPRRKLVIPAIIIGGLLFIGAGVAPDVAQMLNATDLPQRVRHLRYFFNAPSLSSAFAIGAYLLGLATVSVIIPSQTIIQENTNEQNRGKILAVLAVLMNVFAAIPVILAGALADMFGVRPIILVLGGIILLVGILASNPHLFFSENFLPIKLREFLGLGHWDKSG